MKTTFKITKSDKNEFINNLYSANVTLGKKSFDSWTKEEVSEAFNEKNVTFKFFKKMAYDVDIKSNAYVFCAKFGKLLLTNYVTESNVKLSH